MAELRITIHPAAMGPIERGKVNDWYDDQNERLNWERLPLFDDVSSIELLGERRPLVLYEKGLCLSFGGSKVMVCDRPPPIDPASGPGIHVRGGEWAARRA